MRVQLHPLILDKIHNLTGKLAKSKCFDKFVPNISDLYLSFEIHCGLIVIKRMEISHRWRLATDKITRHTRKQKEGRYSGWRLQLLEKVDKKKDTLSLNSDS